MGEPTPLADLTVSNLFSFADHTVLITGGATGLGEMAAQAFVQNGAKVIIASRKRNELEQTSERLNKLGTGRCEWIVSDLKDKAGCQELARQVRARTDSLSVLVNGAGAACDFPEIGFDKVYALNVKAVFYTTVLLQPLLVKNATSETPSRVINVASMDAITTADITIGPQGGLSPPGTGTFSYTPAKAACVHLTKMQASILMPHHVTVNAICPGVFRSRMTEFGFQNAPGSLLARQPSGRVGKAEDFAGLVLYLSSLGAAHLTGNVLEVDGGSERSGLARL